jgi:hypothetical protein
LTPPEAFGHVLQFEIEAVLKIDDLPFFKPW